MRFAAIADVHGNIDALLAVLSDIAAQGIAEIVNLGDHVSGPLEPAATAAVLMERGFPSVRGDQDRLIVEQRAVGAPDRAAHGQLDAHHMVWLAGLPATLLHRDEVLLCHGTPRCDAIHLLNRVTTDGAVVASSVEAIEAATSGTAASLILCGHTHIARVVRLRDGRLVVNAGSVGLPGYRGSQPVEHVVETGTPDACYAILERAGGNWQAGIRYVPYDSKRMVALAARNGYPDWARALATGWLR